MTSGSYNAMTSGSYNAMTSGSYTAITTMNATIEVGGLVDIIGTITMEFFSLVNVVILCSILAVSGLVANVINLCVFYRHGLNNSMNISFFALTMTMLINLLFLLWRIICVYPFMDKSGFHIVFNEIKLLTAGWPNVCVNRVVSWITVYITAERCFSITIPLKVKLVFTSRRAVVVLVLIYVINFMTLIPEYCVLYLDWKFFPSQNKTMIGLVYRTNRPPLEGLTSGLNAIFTVTAFIGMIIFTSILIKVLKQKSKWRRKAMPDKDKTESFSTRQKKTVTMVIALACVMIACYTNSVFVTSVAALVPEFSAYGKLANSYQAAATFTFLSISINSNINIVLFYRMSSKYKAEFKKLFRRPPICRPIDASGCTERHTFPYY